MDSELNVYDLKLGNYVFYQGAENKRLSVITLIYDIDVDVEIIDGREKFHSTYRPNCLEKLEPIPLNGTWLIKFGFDAAKMPYPFIPTWKHGEMVLYDYWPEYYQLRLPTGNVNVKYVHELQNLAYFSMGEEFELNEEDKRKGKNLRNEWGEMLSIEHNLSPVNTEPPVNAEDRLWQEVKSLEQKYKRNLSEMKRIIEEQSGISFKIQKKLKRIHKKKSRWKEKLNSKYGIIFRRNG